MSNEKSIKLEDNKGADFVNIELLQDNLIHIDCGQCGIYTFNCIMPVSLLAGILSDATERYGNPLEIANEIFSDNPQWRDKIKSKIKNVVTIRRKENE